MNGLQLDGKLFHSRKNQQELLNSVPVTINLLDLTWQQQCQGSPRPHSRLNDLLEGLTELRKAVIPTVAIYCSKRIQNKISKGERLLHVGQSSGERSFRLLSPSRVVQTAFTTPATIWENTQHVLPTRDTHPSLNVQCFYCVLVTQV